jgi:hypothetical protein
MNLKLVSKNNVGIVATLILVILLSQSRFFGFLTETPLGRMILLTVIILIAYTNKIFGLLGVLFIIIAFNQNDGNIVRSYNFYEGFDALANRSDDKSNIGNITDDKTKIDDKTITDDKTAKAIKNNISTQNTTTDSSQTDTTSSSRNLSIAREGFCMSDKELNMLRGKQSNTIPVYNKMREQSDEVDPSDKSVFTNIYTSF